MRAYPRGDIDPDPNHAIPSAKGFSGALTVTDTLPTASSSTSGETLPAKTTSSSPLSHSGSAIASTTNDIPGTTTSPPSPPSSNKHATLGTILGAAIGTLLGIVIIVSIVHRIRKAKRRSMEGQIPDELGGQIREAAKAGAISPFVMSASRNRSSSSGIKGATKYGEQDGEAASEMVEGLGNVGAEALKREIMDLRIRMMRIEANAGTGAGNRSRDSLETTAPPGYTPGP